ncbi:MAG: mechanosensitive ion channel [Christensenellaceae bacterium]|jgi:small conductance mechanosensitive channel|nr:mechanosensitive ion channel [Christensenellaceae bacterium]
MGWDDITNAILGFFKNFGTRVLESIVILLLGILAIRIIGKILRAVFHRTKTESAAASFVISLVRATIALFLFFTILKILGIDTTGIVSIAAATGIAVGFALQDSLSNIASGVILLFTKPFKESDFVKIGSTEGKISKVNITTTEIITSDNVLIIVPNKQIIGTEIFNYSKRRTRRISVKIPVAYEADPEKVKAVLLNIINEGLNALASPEPSVYPSSFDSSSVSYTMKFWVETDNYWDSYNAIHTKVLKGFKENNIEIPYDKITILKSSGGE